MCCGHVRRSCLYAAICRDLMLFRYVLCRALGQGMLDQSSSIAMSQAEQSGFMDRIFGSTSSKKGFSPSRPSTKEGCRKDGFGTPYPIPLMWWRVDGLLVGSQDRGSRARGGSQGEGGGAGQGSRTGFQDRVPGPGSQARSPGGGGGAPGGRM